MVEEGVIGVGVVARTLVVGFVVALAVVVELRRWDIVVCIV